MDVDAVMSLNEFNSVSRYIMICMEWSSKPRVSTYSPNEFRLSPDYLTKKKR